MNRYFYIHENDKEKTLNILGAEYTINEHNVLEHNGTEVDYDTSYITKETLNRNGINYWDVIKCPDCGEYTDCFYYIHSKNGDFYVCESCSYNYFYCDDCNEYFDDTYETFETQNGSNICEGCRFSDYTECHCCEELINSNNAYYCDDCDEYFCESCWDEHYHDDSLLYDYHEFSNWRLHHLPEETNENEPEFYIGHELEIDDGDDMEDAVSSISQVDGICMHDGSLSYRGIEFISHPLSYKYMLSKEQDYRALFDHLTNLGYKSHNTTTCGLHFHVTRPENPKVIDRIILFMETYKEEIFKISRRTSTSELNRWARFLSDKRQGTNPKLIKSLDYIVNNKDTSDRYQALNLTNSNTIEFRFFKGTLKYETFMADFEFVNNLVHYASDLTMPVEEMTWTKITSQGKFLPQYIQEHNLQCDTPIIDYSKEIIIEFNKDKDTIRIRVEDLIQDVLREISNRARQKNKTYQKVRVTTSKIYELNEQLTNLNCIIYDLDNMSVFDYNQLNYDKQLLESIERRLNK